MKNILTVIFITFTLSGCWYDNEEDLFGNVECVTTNMSYLNDVVPILSGNNCITCHNSSLSSGGINLDGYDFTKTQALNGKLYGSINHDAGFMAMPQGTAKMDQCQIDKIKAWIDQGTLNN